MKNCFIIAFLLLPIIGFGQDTTFYDNDWNIVNSMDSAFTYSIVSYEKDDANMAIVRNYLKSGQIKTENHYSDYKKYILEGKRFTWYDNGQIHEEIEYKNGKINGYLLTYWNNGKSKRADKYKNGKFIEGKCFSSDGKDTVFYDYEKMPEFQGGDNELLKYLKKELNYPEVSRKNGIQGKVYVSFVVNVDGHISSVKIARSVNKELDDEALRVVKKMPNWKPGRQDGIIVKVTYMVPVNFML